MRAIDKGATAQALAAHGVAGLALVQAPEADAIATTYLATAALSLAIAVALRAWPCYRALSVPQRDDELCSPRVRG